MPPPLSGSATFFTVSCAAAICAAAKDIALSATPTRATNSSSASGAGAGCRWPVADTRRVRATWSGSTVITPTSMAPCAAIPGSSIGSVSKAVRSTGSQNCLKHAPVRCFPDVPTRSPALPSSEFSTVWKPAAHAMPPTSTRLSPASWQSHLNHAWATPASCARNCLSRCSGLLNACGYTFTPPFVSPTSLRWLA